MYTWGCGGHGALGHNRDDEDDKLVLTKLDRELFCRSKVVMVSAGGSHNGSLSDDRGDTVCVGT
jgi:hypothetical protein